MTQKVCFDGEYENVSKNHFEAINLLQKANLIENLILKPDLNEVWNS